MTFGADDRLALLEEVLHGFFEERNIVQGEDRRGMDALPFKWAFSTVEAFTDERR